MTGSSVLTQWKMAKKENKHISQVPTYSFISCFNICESLLIKIQPMCVIALQIRQK